MSMVRGKLEGIVEVAPQNLVVGEVFLIHKGDQWFDSSAPSTPIKVDVFDIDYFSSTDELKTSEPIKP